MKLFNGFARCLPALTVLCAVLTAAHAQSPPAANVFEVRRAYSEAGPGREEQTLAGAGRQKETLFLDTTPLLNQAAVKSASVQADPNGKASVIIRFNGEGAEHFADVTKQAKGKRLAILIDGKAIMAPTIMEEIKGGSVEISGHLDPKEAQALADKLNTAALALRAGEPPEEITFSGASDAPFSAAVALPEGQALCLIGGTGAPISNEKAPAGSRERYGDTKTQAVGALRQIEAELKKAGLELKDVVSLRASLTADKAQGGKFDYPGWFAAYGQFFGTKTNPVKPLCSTVGVASLVNPDGLIEIEAVAAYPPPAESDEAGAVDDDEKESPPAKPAPLKER